ncbi:hypothetical protein JCM14036_24620 [Desulfotomaculum defluvii]
MHMRYIYKMNIKGSVTIIEVVLATLPLLRPVMVINAKFLYFLNSAPVWAANDLIIRCILSFISSSVRVLSRA